MKIYRDIKLTYIGSLLWFEQTRVSVKVRNKYLDTLESINVLGRLKRHIMKAKINEQNLCQEWLSANLKFQLYLNMVLPSNNNKIIYSFVLVFFLCSCEILELARFIILWYRLFVTCTLVFCAPKGEVVEARIIK